MTGALLRLLFLSLRGRVLRWARQLRQPKYLIGFVLGAAWILFWAGNWIASSFVSIDLVGDRALAQVTGDARTALHIVAATGTALLICSAWVLPFGRLALPFKESELHLLLPAPLSRRQLIQYALLKAQVPILVTASIFTIIWGGGRGYLRLFVGIWTFFVILDLHTKWRSMSQLRLRQIDRRVAGAVRVAIYGGLLAFWGLILPRLFDFGIRLYDAVVAERVSLDEGELERLVSRISQVAPDEMLSSLLLPFRWITGPLFAAGPLELALALVPAAILMVLLHEGLVRSRARFEEAAFAHARKEAGKKSPQRRYLRMSRSSRLRAPFALPAVGRPEAAVIWKNLMLFSRIPLAWMTLVALLLLLTIAIVPAVFRAHEAVFVSIASFGVVSMFLAPWISALGFRNDIRGELPMIDLVRTFPISGRRLVLASVLSPALLGTLIGLFSIGLFLAGFTGARLRVWLHDESMASMPMAGATEALGMPAALGLLLIVCGVLPLLVAGTLLCASLNNLGTLMFPAWIGTGDGRNKGMAAMGHQVLFAMVLGLAILIALIPGAVLVGAVIGVLLVGGLGISPWLFPVLGLLAAAPMFAEVYGVVRVGAGLWDRLDPSQELLESGR